MSSSFTVGTSPEAEVLTFKQSNGESLKDAWHRINDAQRKSSKNNPPPSCLETFMLELILGVCLSLTPPLVVTSWKLTPWKHLLLWKI